MGKVKNMHVKRIVLLESNEKYFARGIFDRGTESVLESRAIHSLAGMAVEAGWKIDDNTQYETISKSSFVRANGVCSDPLSGKDIKQFNYWYDLYLKNSIVGR